MKANRLLGFLAGCSLLVAGLQTPALAEDDSDVGEATTHGEQEPVASSDDFGIAGPEDELSGELAAALGPKFAGIGYDMESEQTVIHLVGGPSRRTEVADLHRAVAAGTIRSHGAGVETVARLTAEVPGEHNHLLVQTGADYSATALENRRARLERDWDSIEERGVTLAAFYIDWTKNRIVAHVGEESTTLEKRQVQRLFGPMVEIVWGADVFASATGSAQNNESPFSGGAYYLSEYLNGTCTSGIVWYKGSSNYDNFVSAGHCTGFDVGGNGYRWKNTTTNTWAARTYDSALLYSNRGDWSYADWYGAGTGGHPTIWVGSSKLRFVTNYFNSTHSGVSLCRAGAASGEKCGFTVFSTNVCVSMSLPGMPSNTQFCGMNMAFKSGSDPATQIGDSGGPVYRKNHDGRVTIAGVISGISLQNGSVFIYTPVVTIQEHLSGYPFNCGNVTFC